MISVSFLSGISNTLSLINPINNEKVINSALMVNSFLILKDYNNLLIGKMPPFHAA